MVTSVGHLLVAYTLAKAMARTTVNVILVLRKLAGNLY